MKTVIGNVLTPVRPGENHVLICHQVNCFGAMGAGLAKEVRARYPEVYDAYSRECLRFKAIRENGSRDQKPGLGNVLFCPVSHDGIIIANLFAQYRWGLDQKQTDYAALRTCLKKVAKYANLCKTPLTVRIPYKMSCGYGGGNWDTVQRIIREELEESGVEVEIWKFGPQKKEKTYDSK